MTNWTDYSKETAFLENQVKSTGSGYRKYSFKVEVKISAPMDNVKSMYEFTKL